MYPENKFDGLEPIAVIGMACRFPDADSTGEFWKNIEDGKESIKIFSDEELFSSDIPEAFVNDPSYVKAGSVINNMAGFDYEFFGLKEKEAELIDPQQRKFIECVYEAVEDSGYVDAGDNIISVFGGTRNSTYLPVVSTVLAKNGTSSSLDALLGNTVDQTCLRTSYCLGFKGACIGVQTACSTSIVSIHLACESLLNGECDIAVAGASAITIPQEKGYIYEAGMILSPDGHCRAFDEKANGCVPGNGVGAVVLKRFSEALDDKDHIYALIRGSAINSDGGDKTDYRIPSIKGLANVIKEAVEISEADVEDIRYVEANGTGTFYGDSAEIEAFSRVFRNTDKRNYCCLGSVKANIGHLTQAAGIASFIKTVLALKNKKIPPSINFKEPNLVLEDSPFFVPVQKIEWKTVGNRPRIAGVCAFAIGGTNAFIVLEEFKERTEPEEKCIRNVHLFNISAKDPESLVKMVRNYLFYLKRNDSGSIKDICFTLNSGRKRYEYIFACSACSKVEVIDNLRGFLKAGKNFSRLNNDFDKSGTVFFFPEMNKEAVSHYASIYYGYSQFRESVEYCSTILISYEDESLLKLIKGQKEFGVDYSDAAIFSIQYSIAVLFRAWGIEPDFSMGSGMGRLVAETISKDINIERILDLIVHSDGENQDIRHGFEEFIPKNFGLVLEIGTLSREFEILKERNMEEGRLFLNTYHEEQKAEYGLIQALAVLYSSGIDINWENFHKGCNIRKTTLPSYPLKQKKCWYEG